MTEPLLSQAEMDRLYEEIFEEPVDARTIYQKYYDCPPALRSCAEWVMDQRTWDRIRRDHAPSPTFLVMATIEPGAPEYLVGKPVAIEPFAKLALRCRFGHQHEAAS